MDLKLEDVTGFGVLGLGKMGPDWIATMLEKGYVVVGFDLSEDMRAAATGKVLDALKRIQKVRKDGDKNRIHPDDFAELAIKRFSVADSLNDFLKRQSDYQIVLECVVENKVVKQELFANIADALADDHIFITNTSSLDVQEMGRLAGISDCLVGTHGMNPVYLTMVVEMVRTEAVDDEIFDFIKELFQDGFGMETFEVANVNGFLVNRLAIPFWLQVARELELGHVSIGDADLGLLKSLGHPQGAFLLMDQIGLDVMLIVSMEMYRRDGNIALYPPAILCKLVAEGQLGQKTGQGFYRWDGRKPTGPVDLSNYQIEGPETNLFA